MQECKYLSPEWSQEAARRLKTHLTPEKMKHITSSMLTVYTDCPDGAERAVYYRVVDGVVEELSLQEGELPQAEFTITSDYETFARISQAELKARAALMSGKMTLKGNLVKALRLAPVVDDLRHSDGVRAGALAIPRRHRHPARAEADLTHQIGGIGILRRKGLVRMRRRRLPRPEAQPLRGEGGQDAQRS